MSMTENEIIKKHIEDCEHRIGNILGFMESNSDANTSSCEENISVLKTVIIALEEIQQYRELGTVEEILKVFNNQRTIIATQHETVKQYRSIGTIEEFKALKEKSEPKKPIPLDKRGEYWKCPTCGKYAVNNFGCKYKFCPNCGTGFDWQ